MENTIPLQPETLQLIAKRATSAVKTSNPLGILERIRLSYQGRTDEVIEATKKSLRERVELVISHIGEEDLQRLINLEKQYYVRSHIEVATILLFPPFLLYSLLPKGGELLSTLVFLGCLLFLEQIGKISFLPSQKTKQELLVNTKRLYEGLPVSETTKFLYGDFLFSGDSEYIKTELKARKAIRV